MAEHIAPLLPGFPYLPADARFIGNPIDYIVFDGYTQIKDNRESCDGLEIIVLEIKQGKSDLSRCERAIKQAVENGRMRFEVIRVSDDGAIDRKAWQPRSLNQARQN